VGVAVVFRAAVAPVFGAAMAALVGAAFEVLGVFAYADTKNAEKAKTKAMMKFITFAQKSATFSRLHLASMPTVANCFNDVKFGDCKALR
jgi:hypothetical protein